MGPQVHPAPLFSFPLFCFFFSPFPFSSLFMVYYHNSGNDNGCDDRWRRKSLLWRLRMRTYCVGGKWWGAMVSHRWIGPSLLSPVGFGWAGYSSEERNHCSRLTPGSPRMQSRLIQAKVEHLVWTHSHKSLFELNQACKARDTPNEPTSNSANLARPPPSLAWHARAIPSRTKLN